MQPLTVVVVGVFRVMVSRRFFSWCGRAFMVISASRLTPKEGFLNCTGVRFVKTCWGDQGSASILLRILVKITIGSNRRHI